MTARSQISPQFIGAWHPLDFNQIRHITSAIFGLYVPSKFERFGTKLREIWAKVDQNFKQIFSHAYPKNCLGYCFQTFISYSSTIESGPFWVFNKINWNNIVCIMIHKRTRCKIHITHLMIINLVMCRDSFRKTLKLVSGFFYITYVMCGLIFVVRV